MFRHKGGDLKFQVAEPLVKYKQVRCGFICLERISLSLQVAEFKFCFFLLSEFNKLRPKFPPMLNLVY
jgi:hypothetical protein